MDPEDEFSPYPEFFSIYNSQKHSQRLVLPSNDREHYPNPLPETAVLKKSEGQFWNVKWSISQEETMTFEDGWSKFVTDNGLLNGDLVLFAYEGSRNFCVCIHRNGQAVKSNAPINIQENSDDDNETSSDDDYNENSIETEEEEDSNENMIISLSLGSCDEDNVDQTICEVNKASGSSKKGRIRLRKKRACVGDPEMYLDDPTNPFFISTSPCTRNELVIAMQAIRDFDLKFGDKITFIDEFGEIEGNVGVWRDRVVVHKWDVIYKRNNVEDGDTIICEIVREEGLVKTIKAHFIRQ
ncbi:unnamed protein product [Cochlearia groenlandica]